MAYRACHEGPFRLQPEEIVRGEFLPPSVALERARRESFCPDGLQVLRQYLEQFHEGQRHGIKET
jgi:hypothetical protein